MPLTRRDLLASLPLLTWPGVLAGCRLQRQGHASGHVLAYHRGRNAVCLLGGYQGRAPEKERTWFWNGVHWESQSAPAGGVPFSRTLPGAAYDAAHDHDRVLRRHVHLDGQAERRVVVPPRQRALAGQPGRHARSARPTRRGLRFPARAGRGVRRPGPATAIGHRGLGARRRKMARDEESRRPRRAGPSRDGLRQPAWPHGPVRRPRAGLASIAARPGSGTAGAGSASSAEGPPPLARHRMAYDAGARRHGPVRGRYGQARKAGLTSTTRRGCGTGRRGARPRRPRHPRRGWPMRSPTTADASASSCTAGASGTQTFGDTWEWDGANWRKVA